MRHVGILALGVLAALSALYAFYPNDAVTEGTSAGAVIIIIKVVISLIATGLFSYVVMPTMYELKTDSGLWANVTDPTLLMVRDSLYDLFFYMPLIVGAMVILWGMMASSRSQMEV